MGRRTKEYITWRGAIARCENPKYHAFARYGGRGIKICARWRASFEAFLSDMGPRPENSAIERINNDGNYEPGNCRWATVTEQASNRSSNIRVRLTDGRDVTLKEASAVHGLPYKTVWHRLKIGWSIERALGSPLFYRGQDKRRHVEAHP